MENSVHFSKVLHNYTKSEPYFKKHFFPLLYTLPYNFTWDEINKSCASIF